MPVHLPISCPDSSFYANLRNEIGNLLTRQEFKNSFARIKPPPNHSTWKFECSRTHAQDSPTKVRSAKATAPALRMIMVRRILGRTTLGLPRHVVINLPKAVIHRITRKSSPTKNPGDACHQSPLCSLCACSQARFPSTIGRGQMACGDRAIQD